MRRLSSIAAVAFVTAATVAACVGAGEGSTSGSASVPLCRINFTDASPLRWPLNFFAAERTGRMLQFRAQYGGAVAEYTDHLFFRIDDTEALATQIANSTETDPATGQRQLTVDVTPVGTANSLVHAYLAFRWSCGRTKTTRLGQNVSLPSASGRIVFRSVDRGEGQNRVTEVSSFDIDFRDARPVGDPAPTGFDPPILPTDEIGRAHLTGAFRFEYDNAVPAQGFPGP